MSVLSYSYLSIFENNQTRRHSNEKVVIYRSVPIRRETFAGDKLQLSHRSGTTTISHRRTASDNYESNRLGNNRRSRFCFHKRLPISLNRHKPCRLYDRCIRKSRYLPRKSNPFRCQLYPSKHILRISRVNDRTAPPEYKKIGKGAFAGCTKLKNIDWGNNLQEIAGFAFCDCFSLNTSLPQTLEKIGEYAFKQCTSFTGIDLSLSVLRSIGNQAFLNCTALSSITLPASLQSIGKECFAGCSSLTGITLPQKLESMGEGCFSHCISLTEVDIKECPLENLPPYTFDHCTKLLSIQAPNTITEIGEGAFYYCTSLTDCILPESVRTIGDYAFAGCSRIAGLSSLPEGTEK